MGRMSSCLNSSFPTGFGLDKSLFFSKPRSTFLGLLGPWYWLPRAVIGPHAWCPSLFASPSPPAQTLSSFLRCFPLFPPTVFLASSLGKSTFIPSRMACSSRFPPFVSPPSFSFLRLMAPPFSFCIVFAYGFPGWASDPPSLLFCFMIVASLFLPCLHTSFDGRALACGLCWHISPTFSLCASPRPRVGTAPRCGQIRAVFCSWRRSPSRTCAGHASLAGRSFSPQLVLWLIVTTSFPLSLLRAGRRC